VSGGSVRGVGGGVDDCGGGEGVRGVERGWGWGGGGGVGVRWGSD